MKKMYISFIAFLMIAAVAVWNVELANANDQATSLPGSSFTTVNSVDGCIMQEVRDLIDEWKALVYDCQVQPCKREWSIPGLYTHSAVGTTYACITGSTIAHCWNCKGCNAAWW
jgi:hypothetical protein